MVVRLTITEKEKLVQEERKRRIIARKQQVRVQSDAYTRKVKVIIKRRTEVLREVNSRLAQQISPRAYRCSPRIGNRPRASIQRPNHIKTPQKQQNISFTTASNRGTEALQHLRRCRRSQEIRREAILRRKSVAKEHFNRVAREGAERVPIMQ